jgi:hypothetical protein
MTHTFEIRFDGAENSFGWSGAGQLSVDAQGLRIALKRGLRTLLVRRRSQEIPAESIREVFREGEALRVDFTTQEKTRVVLPFRARDRQTAAQIVQLLPTTRTVELEESPRKTRGAGGRERSRFALVASIAVIAVSGASILVFNSKPEVESGLSAGVAAVDMAAREEGFVPEIPSDVAASVLPDSTEPAAQPAPQMAEVPAPAAQATPPPNAEPATAVPARRRVVAAQVPEAATPQTQPQAESEAEAEGFTPFIPAGLEIRPQEMVVPIPQGTLAFDAARSLLVRFETEAALLSGAYRRDRQRADMGDLEVPAFAANLDSLDQMWRELSRKLLNSREAQDPALTGLRASLLAVASYQSSFLSGYAAGLRANDSSAVEEAFDELKRAEEMLERARLYVR